MIGDRIIRLEVCGSTNDVLLAHPEPASEAEGLVVVADRQTAGRGRRGRSWEAPAGVSLLFSVLLRPPPDQVDGQAGAMSVLGAVALHDVLAEHDARIKWPNDLLLGGLKCGGVLVEARPGAPDERVVVGIGLNVNQTDKQLPPDARVPATSLRLTTGEVHDRDELLTRILAALDRRYAALRGGELDTLEAAWRAATDLIDRRVAVEFGGRTLRGVVEALSLTDLALRTDDGRRELLRGEHTSLLELLE